MSKPVSGGVLDASVVIAALLDEPGLADAETWFADACISTVNLAEVISRLCDLGHSAEDIGMGIRDFGLDTRDFTAAQAHRAGLLREDTRHIGLSLGDRACLALAASLNRPAITADRSWAKLDIGVPVELIR